MAEEITHKPRQQAATKVIRQRRKRLIKMAENPAATLYETERLVTLRSSDAYPQVAELLPDFRETLADSNQSDLVEKQAQSLKKKSCTSSANQRTLPPEFCAETLEIIFLRR